ncbi:uncharacterized protein DS421_20g685910 [Arachis hypogaea]|nr:uncharacterized protein DS421_20g685910 [Arachis hypogaea]
MMVVRMETHSQPKALSIVPIQVYVHLSQTTPVPAIEPSPAKSPREKISEERTKSTPQPPKPDESTPTVPPAPSKILDLTDSSQEEAPTQEGQKAKSPKIPKLIEQLKELVEKIANSGVKTALDYAEGKSPPIKKQRAKKILEKFETPVKNKEMSAEMKEKCYVWATRVETYGDGSTNEYDPVCTLKAQDRVILSKVHFASLKAATHIEAENMAIGNHPDGEFLQPKTKKPFRIEDYPMFIPFLDLKKLASHPYIFTPVCYSEHWWIWVANGICWGAPLRKKDNEIKPPYINISGQKTSYDCAIYEMKWLEIIQPENIKRKKYEWDNWTQEEWSTLE